MKSTLTVSAQALAACVLLGAIPARATDAELDAVSRGQPTISQSITETGGDVIIGGASGTAFSGTINFRETFSASETATTNGVEVGSGGQPTISQSITETGGDVIIGGASGTAFPGTINFRETFSASETATTNGVEVGSGGQPIISQSTTETGGDVIIGGASGTAFSGTINFRETFSASETATTNGVEVGSTFSLTGTLQIGAGGSIVGNVTDNSALAFDRSDNVTFGGIISGTGSLTQLGAGTLILTGANTYAGGTTISAGTLQIGNGGSTGSIVGNVTDSGTLAFDRSDTLTFGGMISGTGSLTQLGTGTTILTGANTYTGLTTINGGTLALSGAGTIASSSGVIDNGTFDISASKAPGATITTLSGTGGVTLGANTLTLSNASAGANGTFGGAISGTGGLTLAAGTETLTGANTYTGLTTISGGTLALSGAGTIASSSGFIDNGAFDISASKAPGATITTLSGTGGVTLGANTLTLTNASAGANGTFGGAISGTGGLTLAAGTETLTGANTYTGNTTISSGSALVIGGAGSLGAGSYAGNITDGGTFEYSSSATQRLSGVISGQGGLTKIGTGTLILTGANTYAGGTLLDVGTLGIGSNGALGAGALTLQLSATLQFEASGLTLPNRIMLNNADPTIDTGSNTDTISGIISGPGGLAKIGSGTLIMSGANTYIGATDVQAGALDVTGSLASSVTVESGASLGGTGAIGGLVANSGATIAPGLLTPFSTLTVNGATSFAAGSIFAVAINPAGQNDKLVSTGSTTISGGTVEVDVASGTYSPSTRYTLITAHGGVSGTFSSLSTSASLAFLDPTLSYDADDVYLGFAVKLTPFLFASVAQTPNQVATALALEAQPPGSSLYDEIIGQTAPGALAAFDALSSEIHASAVSAALDDTRLPREAVLDRLAESDGAPSGGGKNVKTYEFSTPTQVFAAWGQAFDSWGHIGGDGNAATISNNLAGFILGADTTLYGRYRLGVAGGYTNANLDVSARDSSGKVSATYIGLYGGASEGPLQLRGGAFYAYDHYGLSRAGLFPGFAEQEGSGYGGDSWQAFAEAGWRLPVWAGAVGPTWVEPFIGLTGVNLHTASFAETPGAAALNGASQTYGYGLTTLGLRGEASLFTWAPLTMNGMIGWQHVFGDVTPNSVMAFASEPYVPFSIAGAPIARNALALEVGVDWRFMANIKLGVYYSGLIASNASGNAIKVKLEANF